MASRADASTPAAQHPSELGDVPRLDDELLALLLPFVPSAALVVDLQGKVLACNERAAEMFAYSQDELIGLDIEALVPERFREMHVRHRRAFAKRPRARPMGAGLDLYARRSDGSEFPVDISLAPARGNQGALVVVAVSDLSERSSAEERLRQQADRLLMAAERERIARDLHDLVVQRLFGAGLSLQAALALIDDQSAAAKVASAVEELDTTIKEIRQAIFMLEETPVAGIRAKVTEAVAHAREVLGLDVALAIDVPPELSLGPELQVEVVTVLREALSNCARHARARHVEVHLRVNDNLVLTVLDDGVGIGRPARLSGLSYARARAEQMGGELRLRDRPGGGTHFEWRVPLGRPPLVTPSNPGT
jgi:two-component system sensor histidine kinase DevS